MRKYIVAMLSGFMLLSTCIQAQEAKRFEYKVTRSMGHVESESALNELGSQGWEMTHGYTEAGYTFTYFKRPVKVLEAPATVYDYAKY